MKKHNQKNPAAVALGSAGGKALVKKRGRAHMAEISKNYWQSKKKKT